MKVKRNPAATQLVSSQNAKNFHTFLLMQQLAAKEIGQRLALARKEAGMSQEDLAELVDVSKRSLQNHEAGTFIPYKHFRAYAEALNRPVGWFLHGDATPEEGAEDAVERIETQVLELAAMREEDRAERERLQESVDLLLRRLGEEPPHSQADTP
jgi:transcriptional regulator with XRE-family HTH domain